MGFLLPDFYGQNEAEVDDVDFDFFGVPLDNHTWQLNIHHLYVDFPDKPSIYRGWVNGYQRV